MDNAESEKLAIPRFSDPVDVRSHELGNLGIMTDLFHLYKHCKRLFALKFVKALTMNVSP